MNVLADRRFAFLRRTRISVSFFVSYTKHTRAELVVADRRFLTTVYIRNSLSFLCQTVHVIAV